MNPARAPETAENPGKTEIEAPTRSAVFSGDQGGDAETRCLIGGDNQPADNELVALLLAAADRRDWARVESIARQLRERADQANGAIVLAAEWAERTAG